MTTKFELQETAEPNLLDEMFDYSRPPRIQFDGPLVEQIDGKQVCFDPADTLLVSTSTDCTFRIWS